MASQGYELQRGFAIALLWLIPRHVVTSWLGHFLWSQAAVLLAYTINSGEDQLQNFTTDSFRSIFSEARKYRLCLALGHQYITQLPESLRSAVFGNVGTMIALRVGYEDAEILAAHFHPSGPNAMAPHAFPDLSQL
jgi:hypothetical protein